MNYDAFKQKLGEKKKTDTSQTEQSGFSASANPSSVTRFRQKMQAFSNPESKVSANDVSMNPTQPIQIVAGDAATVERGRQQYEADKAAYHELSVPKFMEWLGLGTGGWIGEHRSYEDMPQNREGWGVGIEDRYIEGMDDDTLNKFYTTYADNPDAAIDYASNWQKLKAYSKAEENRANTEKALEGLGFHDTWAKDVAKTAAGIGSMALTPIDVIEQGADYMIGGAHYSEDVKAGNKSPFTTMSSQFQSDVVSDIRGGRSEEEARWYDKALTTLYNVGYSTAQSTLIMGTFGPAGLALFGTSAAASTLQESLANGDSDDVATGKAIAAGLIEALTETISLEKVLKMADSKTKKELVKNILKAMGAEASEEVASDVLNYITDILLSGDSSEFAQTKAELLATNNAHSDAEASWKAIMQKTPDVLYSGLTGALSGGLMAGVGTAMHTASNKASARTVIGDYVKSGRASELYDIINASEAREGKAAVGETTSDAELVEAYLEMQRGTEIGAIRSRLEQLGVPAEESLKAAEGIYHEGNEYVVPRDEKKAIDSDIARTVLEEYQQGLEDDSTEWLRGARALQRNISQPQETPVVTESAAEEYKRIRSEIRGEEEVARQEKLQEAETTYRKAQLEDIANMAGIDVESLASQHIGITTERYAKALETAYQYGAMGLGLEKVASVTGLPTEGAISTVYDAGLKQYTEDKRTQTKRVSVSGKVHFATAAELKKINTAGGTNFTAVDTETLKKDAPKWAAVQFLAKFVAPRIGRKIIFFDGGKSTNGWRTSNAIYINVNGKMTGGKEGDVLGIFMHEFGHDLRADAPELFNELQQVAINEVYKGDAERFTRAVKEKMAARAAVVQATGEGAEINEAQATEEIVCDALAKIAGDEDALKRLFVEHRTLGQRILDFFRKILNDLRTFIKTYGGDNNYSYFVDTSAMEKMVGILEKYTAQIDEKAAASPAKAVSAAEQATIAETSSDAKKVAELAESGIEYDPSTETAMFSARDIPQNEEEVRLAVDRLSSNLGISKAEARQWVESELSAASLILDPKFSDLLDYKGDRRYTAIKKNSDYPQGTLDFSNICRKRRQYTALMQRLQKQYPDRVFSAAELAEIREILLEEGLDVACGLCYVEDRRQREGEIAQGFQEAMKRWLAGDREGFNKQQTKALSNLQEGDEVPSIYDLTTLEGMNGLREKAANVALAWEKFNNARGMQSARLLQGEAEYKRQILKYKAKQVQRINDLGGLRIYSFSDFEEFHLIDIIQAVQDCAAVGLKIQFYTKVPSFAKLMMDTGAKGNRSLIPLGELGYHMEGDRVVLDYDTREGININDPDFFDSIDHPNIGNALVGINDTQIGAAFLDPFVDYIIPFHTGQSQEIRRIKKIDGWENYKDYQEDKPLQKGGRTKPINIYTEVLQAAEKEGNPITNERQFVEKFLEVCRKEGMKPRFWQFLNVDENGNYAYRKGYYKLLLDFKLFDKNGNILPQNAVTGQFDTAYIQQILTSYAAQKLEQEKTLQPKLDRAYARINEEIVGDKQFSMGGIHAKTANRETLRRAEEMEESGIDSETIRKETGWVRDQRFGGIWMFELADTLFDINKVAEIVAQRARAIHDQIKRDIQSGAISDEEATRQVMEARFNYDRFNDFGEGTFTLGDIYQNDELYAAYPFLQDAKIVFTNDPAQLPAYANGQYNPGKNTIELRPNLSQDAYANAMIHELQHAIQEYEGWGEFTNPDAEKQKIIKELRGRGIPQEIERLRTKRAELESQFSDARKSYESMVSDYLHKHFPSDMKWHELYRGRLEGLAGYIQKYADTIRLSPASEYLESAAAIREEAEKKYKRFRPEIFDQILEQGKQLRELEDELGQTEEDLRKALYEANPQRIENKATQQYMDNPTEIQARDAEARLRYSAEQRRQIRPNVDEGVDPGKEDIRFSQNETVPTFYSQMAKVVAQQKADKFDARSLINMLLGKGVKAEEIKWSGISAWLDGRKSVTKEELLEFIRGSMLQIDEEWLRTEEDMGEMSSAEWDKAYQHTYDAAVEIIEDMWRFKELKDKETAIDSIEIEEDYDGTIFTVQAVIDGEEKTILKYNMRERKTRWERYVLPGESDALANYRELLFIMPGSDYTNDAMRRHWERPGVLAHARIEDRWDYPNAPMQPLTGETAPMLFIEEIQSDWHNAGAKEGYLGQSEAQIGIKKLRKFRESGIPALRAAAQGLSPDELVGMVDAAARDARLNWNASISDDFFELKDEQGEIVAISPVVNPSAFLNSIGFELGRRINEYGKGKTPDAPFKNGKYVEYVLKRLIRLAAEQGYAQIGWTAAEQQIFRWSSDYAEAYRIEYDQDIPKFLNKFGKQWGAKVSQTTLTSEDAETVWTFPITEAMRESVVSEGLPLYSMNERAPQSMRDIDDTEMTPREYLATVTYETIRDEADRAELRKIIDEYREIDERKPQLESEIASLEATKAEQEAELDLLQKSLKKTSARYAKKVTELIKRSGTMQQAIKDTQAQIDETQDKLNKLRAQQGRDTKRLHEILTMPRVESIIEAQRKLVREYRELVDSTKAADKAKLEALRARMNDKLRAEVDRRIEMRKQMMERYNLRQAQKYYLPRIQKIVDDLSKNVTKAPVPFRGPIYNFLSLLDMRTRDKDGNIRAGQANIDRETFRANAATLLGTGSGSIVDWLQRYGIVLTDDVVSWIEDSRNYLEWMVLNQAETDIRTATADQLKSLYQFARSLNQTLKKFSKSYTNVNLDMSDTSEEAIDYARTNWGKRANDRIRVGERGLRWTNAQPVTVFDRLGPAGQRIFKLLAQGGAKKAFNEQAIADFTETWDKESTSKWVAAGAIDVKFTDGDSTFTVPMTPLQMMDLYCTAQDPAGLRHLLVGGFCLDHIVKRGKISTAYETDETRHITEGNIQELIDAMNAYDAEMIPFADKLREFVDTVGSRWGNQVSIARFGYEQFTEDPYWPLVTVRSEERGDVTKSRIGKDDVPQHIFDLVNKSFTKERTASADNAIVVKSIFTVFFDHIEGMALYNAYALPILDTARFLRYQTYDENGHPTYVMDKAFNDAFGTKMMQTYIEQLLVDINGDRTISPEESFLMTGLRLRNRVAVAYNLRVVVQQPLSLFRAFDIIDPKYVTPFKDVKGMIAEMAEHSGIARTKLQGYYGADVKLSLMEKAIGTGPDLGNKVYDFTSKVTEVGMLGAEAADNITWATLWNACKNWVKATDPTLEGNAFYEEVDARFSDIIYRTQVVDSVLQKSEMMRRKTPLARFLSSFKGEPTTTYNMLLRQYDKVTAARQSGRKISGTDVKSMLRTFTAWGVQAAVLALVTALADAWRDDDDYETAFEKIAEALFGEYKPGMSFKERLKEFSKSNVFDAYNFLELPWVSELLSLWQGYTPSRVDLMLVQQLIDAAGGIAKFIGDPSVKNTYKLLGSVSVLSGLPFQNVAREVIALWNNTIGALYPEMKLQTSPEPASSGYEALYVAMKNGQSVRALELVDEIMGNVGDAKKAYAGVTSQIREAYRRGDITEDDAYEYMAAIRDYFGYSPNTDIRKQIAGWKD